MLSNLTQETTSDGSNNNGRIQKITDYLDGSFTTTYSYDDYNRLSSATSGTVLTRSYGYDAWGNLTNVTTGGTANPPGQPSFTLNYVNNGYGAPATNRINTIVEGTSYSVGYDAAGNLTSDNSTGATYTYDGASRLKTASTANSSYEYDGDGRRVRQVVNGNSTYYLWSSVLGQPVVELNNTGGIARAHVYSASGQRLALQASNGSFYWVHGDHLGSSHKLTDTSGNVAYTAEYDPHGNLRLETGTTTLTTRKFTGYERDAANLDFANARTYSYRRGRFLRPDPLMLGSGDLESPQSLNLYSYVGNDPINFVDPSGLLMICFGFNVWINRVDAKTGEVISSTYGGFLTSYCIDLGAGGGGRGGLGRWEQGGRGSGGGKGKVDPNKAIDQTVKDALNVLNKIKRCEEALKDPRTTDINKDYTTEP